MDQALCIQTRVENFLYLFGCDPGEALSYTGEVSSCSCVVIVIVSLLECECPKSSSVPWRLSTGTDEGGFGVRPRGASVSLCEKLLSSRRITVIFEQRTLESLQEAHGDTLVKGN